MSKKQNISKVELITIKLKELETLKSTNKFWNIAKEQGEYISNLILAKKPQNILELGTSNGYSTIWIAKNLENTAHITTIEVDSNRFEISKKNFSECNLSENITQIQGEILEILNSNNLENQKFDLIFLDALQREYLNLIKLIEKKEILTENFLIVADNVLSHGNMAEFIKYMQENYKTQIINLGGGFLVAEPQIKIK